MAHLDLLEKCTDADTASLFWWRRDAVACADAEAATPLTERLVSFAERAAPAIVELPGNRLRAKAEARRAREAQALKEEIAADAELLAALGHERRNAMVGLATAMVAAAAPATAMVYAATTQQPIALCFAMAGTLAASFALYQALRWFQLTRADALPNVLA